MLLGDCECFHDPRQRSGLPYDALLDSQNSPSGPSKGLGNAPVTALVRLNLVAPEFRVGAGKVLTAASVPETAIYKHSYFSTGPCEIGFTDNGPMLAIASDSSRP